MKSFFFLLLFRTKLRTYLPIDFKNNKLKDYLKNKYFSVNTFI